MSFLSPPHMEAPPPPPPPPPPPSIASTGVKEAEAAQRAAAAAASGGLGFNGTVKSSSQGASSPTLATKNLLGG